jgi:hypothetical protein
MRIECGLLYLEFIVATEPTVGARRAQSVEQLATGWTTEVSEFETR